MKSKYLGAILACLVLLACGGGTKVDVVKSITFNVPDPVKTEGPFLLVAVASTDAPDEVVFFPTDCLTACTSLSSFCRKNECGYTGTDADKLNLTGEGSEGNGTLLDITQDIVVYACFVDAEGNIKGSGRETVTEASADIEVGVPAGADFQDCSNLFADLPPSS